MASNLSLENTQWDSWLLFLASEQLQADTAGDTAADVDTAADGDTACGGGVDQNVEFFSKINSQLNIKQD